MKQECCGKYLLQDLHENLDDILPKDTEHFKVDHNFKIKKQDRVFSARTKFIGCSDDGNPLFARIYTDITDYTSLEKQFTELSEDRTLIASLVENAPLGLVRYHIPTF